MPIRYGFVLPACLALAMPAQAAIVFSTDFNDEGNGQSVENYTGFSGLTVVDGPVDLIRSGDFGAACDGLCVDLNSWPARLVGNDRYSFQAGEKVVIGFTAGGIAAGQGSSPIPSPDNAVDAIFDFTQQINLLSQTIRIDGVTIFSGGPIANVDTTGISQGVLGNAPFRSFEYEFVPQTAGELGFYVGAGNGTQSQYGPLLDSMFVSIGATAVPEPATWSMMLGGLVLIGAVLRRQQPGRVSFG